MRTTATIISLATILCAAGCRDGNSPTRAPLTIATDSASYTIASGGTNTGVEVSFTNTSGSAVWIGSCGDAYDSRPGTLPAIKVYGTETVNFATNPPTSALVPALCSGDPVPYALAPGMGVRMVVVYSQPGHYALSAPFATTEGGAYDQRARSSDFSIAAQ